MQRKEIVKFSFIGIPIIVVLFFVFYSSKGKDQTKISKVYGDKKAESDEQKTSANHSDPLELFTRLEEETKTLEVKRDPFFKQPAEITNKPFLSSEFYLSGIVWDKDNPTAIINNKIVKIGAEIAGSTVVNIKEDRVILNDGIRNFELKMD